MTLEKENSESSKTIAQSNVLITGDVMRTNAKRTCSAKYPQKLAYLAGFWRYS
jgi:hypothetical protein